MELNKYLIQQLKEGKIAVKNTGNVQLLRQILKEAFPTDAWSITGGNNYYQANPSNNRIWTARPQTDLPYVKTQEFFQTSKNKEMNRFPFSLDPKGQQKIIGCACSTWQFKLAKLWGSAFMLGQTVNITEEFYKEMRGACTSAQHVVLDEVFGKDAPKWGPKAGDWVTCVGDHSQIDAGAGFKKDLTFQVTSLTSPKIAFGGGNGHGVFFEYLRAATEEEIKKATAPADGTPCLVRDSFSQGWYFRYANGKGEFYDRSKKSGTAISWRYFQILDDLSNLPANI